MDGMEHGGNWHAATAALREEFRTLLSAERLRELHRVSGWRHALVAFRQFALAAGCVAAIVLGRDLWFVWLPAAVLLGFLLFSFTVLLHEVVHRAVFRRRETRWNRVLAWLYALPSGLAPGQFTRWHLDHHAELAAREAAGYPAELRRRLKRQRIVVVAVHLALIGALAFAGWDLLFKLYVLPVFFVFPVAFTINRLGQHYDIEPDDPACWGTILRSNPAWDFLFLWSSYHMEHHYFPAVPFYNLKRLHAELKPVFERHPMRVRTYGGLLWDWFVRNKHPHLSWH